jgi:four helix bundle protein
MKDGILKQKSVAFSLRVLKLCRKLSNEKREFVLSQQLLRSGCSVAAIMHEAEHAESRHDFIHKLSIAQKEANETTYWFLVLREDGLITPEEYESYNADAVEILKIITSSKRTAKKNGEK